MLPATQTHAGLPSKRFLQSSIWISWHSTTATQRRFHDPFLDLTEFDAQWVADVQWTYECRFLTPDHINSQNLVSKGAPTTAITPNDLPDKSKTERMRHIHLVFKGLDTISTVILNDVHLLDTNNMITEYTVEVTRHLRTNGKDNVLLIRFDSASLAGLDRASYDLLHAFPVPQAEVSRAAIRKAEYQWGWDGGPVLNTAGSWQPVILDSFDAPFWRGLRQSREKDRKESRRCSSWDSSASKPRLRDQ